MLSFIANWILTFDIADMLTIIPTAKSLPLIKKNFKYALQILSNSIKNSILHTDMSRAFDWVKVKTNPIFFIQFYTENKLLKLANQLANMCMSDLENYIMPFHLNNKNIFYCGKVTWIYHISHLLT